MKASKPGSTVTLRETWCTSYKVSKLNIKCYFIVHDCKPLVKCSLLFFLCDENVIAGDSEGS